MSVDKKGRKRTPCQSCGGDKGSMEENPHRTLCVLCQSRRRCPRCKKWKSIDEFPPGTKGDGSRAGRGVYGYCRACASDRNHGQNLKRYSLTSAEYVSLLEAQGYVCAICQRPPRSKRLAVDHDHTTGAIRGLLCAMCNHKILGAAMESSDVLRRAAQYLDSPPAARVLGDTTGRVKNNRPKRTDYGS